MGHQSGLPNWVCSLCDPPPTSKLENMKMLEKVDSEVESEPAKTNTKALSQPHMLEDIEMDDGSGETKVAYLQELEDQLTISSSDQITSTSRFSSGKGSTVDESDGSFRPDSQRMSPEIQKSPLSP